jgi:hypothetical protein
VALHLLEVQLTCGLAKVRPGKGAPLATTDVARGASAHMRLCTHPHARKFLCEAQVLLLGMVLFSLGLIALKDAGAATKRAMSTASTQLPGLATGHLLHGTVFAGVAALPRESLLSSRTVYSETAWTRCNMTGQDKTHGGT